MQFFLFGTKSLSFYESPCASLSRSHSLGLSFFSYDCSWFREGSKVPLQSYALKGGSKNHYTNATLQILPRRADDGAKYICVVWNRAMPEGHTLETSVALNVNCEYGGTRRGAQELKWYEMEPSKKKTKQKRTRKNGLP